eukprot:11118099-Alexandrium_andersonii.AAC.1
MRWRARWPRKPERGICPRFAGQEKAGYFVTVRRARHRCLVRWMARVEREGLRRVAWRFRRRRPARPRPPRR